MKPHSQTLTRCSWAESVPSFYQEYHDAEWGVPVHDDQRLFEMLILEGAQAGLSWESILKRREGYRQAFKSFDPSAVARMSDEELETLMTNASIIRHRLKIFSARKNALAFLAIQREFGSFDAYVWRFVGGHPQINRPKTRDALRATSPESDALAKDLKKRGLSFVGPTIIYAYMQAVGMVNDHSATCFRAVE